MFAKVVMTCCGMRYSTVAASVGHVCPDFTPLEAAQIRRYQAALDLMRSINIFTLYLSLYGPTDPRVVHAAGGERESRHMFDYFTGLVQANTP